MSLFALTCCSPPSPFNPFHSKTKTQSGQLGFNSGLKLWSESITMLLQRSAKYICNYSLARGCVARSVTIRVMHTMLSGMKKNLEDPPGSRHLMQACVLMDERRESWRVSLCGCKNCNELQQNKRENTLSGVSYAMQMLPTGEFDCFKHSQHSHKSYSTKKIHHAKETIPR